MPWATAATSGPCLGPDDLASRRWACTLRPHTEEVGSGDGPLSVRVLPSCPKRDCTRWTTSTGGKAPANVHAKSRLTLALRTLRTETKGQAGACPDRTRAIPCKVRVDLLQEGLRRVDSSGNINSSDQRQAAATGDRRHNTRTIRCDLGYVRPEKTVGRPSASPRTKIAVPLACH